MADFNFHTSPMYAETLVIAGTASGLTQTVFDGVTGNNQAWNQNGSKRRKARAAKITLDNPNSIRWTVNGTTPVGATTGNVARQFDVILLDSYSKIAKFSAIRDGASSGDIQVEYYG
jgi:hypothetical protein